MDRFSHINQTDYAQLDGQFLELLARSDQSLCDRLIAARSTPTQISSADYSKLIIELSPYLDDFFEEYFDVHKENAKLKSLCEEYNALFDLKRNFVQRYALQKHPLNKYSKWSREAIDNEMNELSSKLRSILGIIDQFKLALAVAMWRYNDQEYANEIDIAARYCSLMVFVGSKLSIFDVPQKYVAGSKVRPHRLKKLQNQFEESEILGFDHRDQENTIDNAQLQSAYCIYCHNQEKDSCRAGFDEQKKGCPLDQKISEMNRTRRAGYNIGALAIITIDNPLVAITGHRICNDCAEGCIFQKQDPVNVPLVETNILNSVLKLPYGVEIYYLLTQWNPLKLTEYLPSAPTGKKALVTGLGPAGMALSYYLLHEGHQVVGIDGLKISPLPFDPSEPIVSWRLVKEQMSKRLPSGFGGVAEYGITARWDKNYLTLVRIILERQQRFNLHGSCRLGSNLTLRQALHDYGFDHVSLCLGAGKPRYLPDRGYFLKGVKSAADFLMQLHQGAPNQETSNSNLQIRLPAIVVGCGLTAVDSAVEILNYYPKLVENFAKRNSKELLYALPYENRVIANEYFEHAKILGNCRTDKERLEKLYELGGVRIVYRKELSDSPAYRQNSEEVEQLLGYGIPVDENVEIVETNSDAYGAIEQVKLSDGRNLPVRTLLVSVGTEATNFVDQSKYFDEESDFFKRADKRISYFGDCNPEYHGSVVKALASVKDGYKHVSEALNQCEELGSVDIKLERGNLGEDLRARIVSSKQIEHRIFEITIHAPLATRNAKPGQFFRLQNYAHDIVNIMEPLALTAAKIDKEEGLLTFLVADRGKTSHLFCSLPEGEEVAMMGPTGEASPILKGGRVTIIAEHFASAILFSYIKSLKDNGCHITLISQECNIYRAEIEALVDQALWASELNEIAAALEQNIGHAEYVYCMASDDLMKRINRLVDHKKQNLICSLNLPMQCMMKGICGQCIQKVEDRRGYIFTCSAQDQRGESIDYNSLMQRHSMNSLLERY